MLSHEVYARRSRSRLTLYQSCVAALRAALIIELHIT
jgi:hypothetical protein